MKPVIGKGTGVVGVEVGVSVVVVDMPLPPQLLNKKLSKNKTAIIKFLILNSASSMTRHNPFVSGYLASTESKID